MTAKHTIPPIDLDAARAGIEESRHMTVEIRAAEDRADRLIEALFQALSSEDAVEAMRTTLVGVFLEGGSSGEGLEAHFGTAGDDIGSIRSMLEDLAGREDPATAIRDIGSRQVETINDISRRLLTVEDKILGRVRARPQGSQGRPEAGGTLLDMMSWDQSRSPPSEGERRLMSESAAVVSTRRDYVPARDAGHPSSGTYARANPRQHLDLKGTPRKDRATNGVRVAGRRACMEAGRLMSCDEIRRAAVHDGLDLTKFRGGFVRGALSNSFLCFGQDGWWPADLPVPADADHRKVYIPRLKNFREQAEKTVKAMNASRAELGIEPCEVIFRPPVTRRSAVPANA
jgi:hypothetical protein